jgi:uroporphyrinogen-III synthase
MKSILSTKKLSTIQKDQLLQEGVCVVDYDAIAITFLDFEAPEVIDNAIFTSQQAVRSFLEKSQGVLSIKNCFCVGHKTKFLLEENGLKVIEIGQNATELAQNIAKNYKNCVFYYFCGTIRREELPKVLKSEKIGLFEVKTYKTVLKTKKFDQNWDGILFFSPSGVASYISENKHQRNTHAFCIGQTTAASAKKHFKSVVVAPTNTIESVLEKTIEAL